MRLRLLPLLAAPALLALGGPAAAALSPNDGGLLGRQDPASSGRYDVSSYTQALALLGVQAGGLGADPRTAQAAQWLVRQQCPDGGWELLDRADVAAACTVTDPVNFVGEDTNTTAVAVQALHALGVTPGHDPLPWLRAAQNSDGGFGYVAGGPSDPNSTGLVTQALVAAGVDPSTVTSGGSDTPLQWLLAAQLGCAAPAADRGGFETSFNPGAADLAATSQAVPGLAGVPFPLPAATATADRPTLSCPATRRTSTPRQAAALSPAEDAAGYGATWLAAQVNSTGFVAGPGGPAYGSTLAAALAIASTRTNRAALDRAAGYLADHVDPAVQDDAGVDRVGALGSYGMLLAATGSSEGASEVAARILASCRCVAASPSPSPRATPSPTRTPVSGGGGAGVADPTDTGSLPFTGGPGAVLLLLAAGLVTGGTVVRRAARR